VETRGPALTRKQEIGQTLIGNPAHDARKSSRDHLAQPSYQMSLGLGLCTFADGVGQLDGFHARINVSPIPNSADYHWDGTYSFDSDADR
jgi:hypothetical protein